MSSESQSRATNATNDETTLASPMPILRQQIENRVRENAIAIVDGAIIQAKNGNCVVMKFLFEMVGLYPVSGSESPEESDSLADVLLHRLGLVGIDEPPTADTVK